MGDRAWRREVVAQVHEPLSGGLGKLAVTIVMSRTSGFSFFFEITFRLVIETSTKALHHSKKKA